MGTVLSASHYLTETWEQYFQQATTSLNMGTELFFSPTIQEPRHYLVGHKGRDGKAGIITHTVVVAEGKRKQPFRYVVLGHHFLVLCPSKQGEVGQSFGTAPQYVVVGAAAAPTQNHIQASQVYHLWRDQHAYCLILRHHNNND